MFVRRPSSATQAASGTTAARSGAEEFVAIATDLAAASDDVVLITLSRADGEEMPRFEPGAHVDLLLRPGLERQYSLCGTTADLRSWQVAVLREPESRGGSEFVHTALATGDTLTIRGPRNHFPLAAAGRYILIAGGIGVTPLIPMIEELESRGADWKLIYGGRTRCSMAFVDHLSAYGDRVTVWPADERGLIDLDSVLGDPQEGTAVYCCGPGPLIEAVEAKCSSWPEGALHIERFAPKEGVNNAPWTEFEVEMRRSGVTFTVGADETILDAAEENGLNLEMSCREGTCATCLIPVIEGIPDHRDSVLSKKEQDAGDSIVVCCSRSHSPRLVLDA